MNFVRYRILKHIYRNERVEYSYSSVHMGTLLRMRKEGYLKFKNTRYGRIFWLSEKGVEYVEAERALRCLKKIGA
jgi:hypothetical protein